jgi:hypothetical protein
MGKFVIQTRYPPGTPLTETMGGDWRDVGVSVGDVTPERAQEVLELTRARFPNKEFRLKEDKDG